MCFLFSNRWVTAAFELLLNPPWVFNLILDLVYAVLDAFFGTEDPALANVDVMTDVSMAPTAFTRYTVAPSTVSRTSKRSSRSKRKLERKVGSGRKGTVDEEEYLLKSVGKLVDRFKNTRGIYIYS